MESLSDAPMKFGSRKDISTALTELRWLEKNKDYLTEPDFDNISEKYHFPVDFLKTGLSGFTYPDDYLISKSKWYPIIYFWICQEKQYSDTLLSLNMDYFRTYSRIIRSFVISFSIPLFLFITLMRYTSLEIWEIILSLVLPFAFIYVELYIEFKSRLN